MSCFYLQVVSRHRPAIKTTSIFITPLGKMESPNFTLHAAVIRNHYTEVSIRGDFTFIRVSCHLQLILPWNTTLFRQLFSTNINNWEIKIIPLASHISQHHNHVFNVITYHHCGTRKQFPDACNLSAAVVWQIPPHTLDVKCENTKQDTNGTIQVRITELMFTTVNFRLFAPLFNYIPHRFRHELSMLLYCNASRGMWFGHNTTFIALSTQSWVEKYFYFVKLVRDLYSYIIQCRVNI